MHEEAAFLRALFDAPDDDAVRLVYADWLQERDDPRAEFLRLDCQLHRMPASDRKRPELRKRLAALALTLEPDWVALTRRESIPDLVESTCHRIERTLPGLNYVVSLYVHRMPALPDASVEDYLRAAFGEHAGTITTLEIDRDEMLGQVDYGLSYPGDRGAYPPRAALESEEFARHLRTLLGYLRRSADEATGVWSYSGYSMFYPVFWDFSFVIVKPLWAVIVHGASSD